MNQNKKTFLTFLQEQIERIRREKTDSSVQQPNFAGVTDTTQPENVHQDINQNQPQDPSNTNIPPFINPNNTQDPNNTNNSGS